MPIIAAHMSRLGALLLGVLFALIAVPAHAQLVTATPTLPDLTIESMLVESQTAGDCSTEGSLLGVRVVVANRGGSGAGPFAVDVNGVRQRVTGLAVGQTISLWFRGFRVGLNTAAVDPLQEVLELNEGNNQSQALSPALTQAPTCTPTATTTPTATATFTPTPTVTLTLVPTATIAPTETPSGGIRLSIAPGYARLQPGSTIGIDVTIAWNPANERVDLSHAGADLISDIAGTNATWVPGSTIVGLGTTKLVLGSSNTIAPGLYVVTITGTTAQGAATVDLELEFVPPTARFEAEIQRRGEYGVYGPEVIPPYRGGDGFYYESRVNSLLQWRPEINGYFNTNTSEWVDRSQSAAGLTRLPPTILDDGSAGNWNTARQTRLAWITDPLLRDRFLRPPTGHSGPWDENGSIVLYGLPVSQPVQMGPYVVQRFQRAVFRHWVANTPAHPEWRDTVSIVPLQQTVFTFLPEIDPVAAVQVAVNRRETGAVAYPGYWEIDAAAANGFASVHLENDASEVARVAIGNPTGTWTEVMLVGPTGTHVEAAPGQSLIAQWPGMPPLSWIVEPGGRIVLDVHKNRTHADPVVRDASVVHAWARPSARSAMARVVAGIAAVGVPEAGDLNGARLATFYRALLDSASRLGASRSGCMVALDGDVNAGDEVAFDRNLACIAREPISGWILAEAAAQIGVGVDPGTVSSRLSVAALRQRIGRDPATGWVFWNLYLDGREPGGRIRISRTGTVAQQEELTD